MKMAGAQAVVKVLEDENVNVIFGYPGAANAPIYNALSKSQIKHILTRHEQAAAHAANAYSRVTNKVGVCMATSGPGATNLITGIATAYMDSIPLVAITGQVPTEMIGRDVFQEVDITGATAPFCKHNYLVKNSQNLVKIIKEAFYIASTGRPGPVLVDIPIDIQQCEVEYKLINKVEIRSYKPTYKGHILQIKKISNAIKQSHKPVICAGGGVISSNASNELVKLAEKIGIPVATTLMGIGSIPTNHPLCLGMLGSHGTYEANNAVKSSDLLIIIGARAGDRATGSTDKFARNARIIHIDIDPAEIGKNLGTDIPVVGDVKTILIQLEKYVTNDYKKEWVNQVQSLKRKSSLKINDCGYVNPKFVLKILSEVTNGNAIVTTEVGQNQIWAANYYQTIYPRSFLTSGGLGTMGYGFPAAIGAKVGNPNKTVIVIAGDGSFQMSIQELGTIAQWDIDIKILIFNNGNLGMVRELQKLKYESNYFAVELKGNPDFVKLVSAYGIKGKKIKNNSQVKDEIIKALNHQGSYLLEFIIDPNESTL